MQRKRHTPKQKRASERNWAKARTVSAHSACGYLAQFGRSEVEKYRAKQAADLLKLIFEDWDREEHK